MEIIATNKYKGFQPHSYASKNSKSEKKISPISPASLIKTKTPKKKRENNGDVKKFKATSESVSMLFKKVMRTKGDHKILQDLEELARGLCKLLQISTVEIVFVDDDICNLLKLTEKQ